MAVRNPKTLTGANTVAGNNTEIQFNDNGVFGSESAFTYDKTVNTMDVDRVDLRWLNFESSTIEFESISSPKNIKISPSNSGDSEGILVRYWNDHRSEPYGEYHSQHLFAVGNIANTAAKPSLAIGTRSNGFYYSATNEVAISTAGVQAMRWNADQSTTFNSAFTFPVADGTANQCLKTDGAGNVDWATVDLSGYLLNTGDTATGDYVFGSGGDTVSLKTTGGYPEIELANSSPDGYALMRYNMNDGLTKYFIGYGTTHVSQARQLSFKNSTGSISFLSGGLSYPTNRIMEIETTGIEVIDGTYANPAYSFVDDTDTGMYRSASNTIGFAASQVIVNGGTGPANLHIVADSDNVNENDTATLTLSQDGDLITGALGFDSSNNLVLDHTGVVGAWGPALAQNGSIKLQITQTGDTDLGSNDLTTTGDITCDTLNYTTLNPAIDLSGYLLNTTDAFTGTLTITGALEVDTLDFNGNVITDSTGTISFADDHITTTGTVTAEQLTSTDDITLNGILGFDAGSGHGNIIIGPSTASNSEHIRMGDINYAGTMGSGAIDIQTIHSTGIASGGNSVAIGVHNSSSQSGSSCFGGYNTCGSAYSVAVGFGNTTSGYYVNTAVGASNSVGGSTGRKSTICGAYNTSAGNASVVAGYYNTANTMAGNYTTTLGGANQNQGVQSLAAGYGNNIASTSLAGGVALGYGNQISGQYICVGVGYSNTVSASYASVFGGSYITNSTANSVEIGPSNSSKVRITSGGLDVLTLPIKPASMTNASAPNNSIYYSTTNGKLVYKNSAGTVNNLY